MTGPFGTDKLIAYSDLPASSTPSINAILLLKLFFYLSLYVEKYIYHLYLTIFMAKKGMSKIKVERNNVFFVGLKQLDKTDAESIKDLIYEKWPSIEREIKANAKLKITFKTYKHGGRDKFSVHMLLDYPGKPIIAEKVYEPVRWDVVAITHKLLEKIKKEVIKKFRTDTSYVKDYS